jgi:L-ascorbate metabolism protein UlaG (beta-lactamase superfamily)
MIATPGCQKGAKKEGPMQRGLFHFCIVIEAPGAVILCDPWLSGEVFNHGWRLAPPLLPDDGELARVRHLFISHEQPDHLHPHRLKPLQRRNLPDAERLVSAYGACLDMAAQG